MNPRSEPSRVISKDATATPSVNKVLQCLTDPGPAPRTGMTNRFESSVPTGVASPGIVFVLGQASNRTVGLFGSPPQTLQEDRPPDVR